MNASNLRGFAVPTLLAVLALCTPRAGAATVQIVHATASAQNAGAFVSDYTSWTFDQSPASAGPLTLVTYEVVVQGSVSGFDQNVLRNPTFTPFAHLSTNLGLAGHHLTALSSSAGGATVGPWVQVPFQFSFKGSYSTYFASWEMDLNRFIGDGNVFGDMGIQAFASSSFGGITATSGINATLTYHYDPVPEHGFTMYLLPLPLAGLLCVRRLNARSSSRARSLATV
jgi:hypothetical protein